MYSRTPSGIRNTDLFYRDEYIVFVEGDDDIPFWRIFFPEHISSYKRKLKPVGGSEIKHYADQICNETTNFVVALDSDYRLFMNKIYSHEQIVETLSYSIENIIINPDTLTSIIRVESRQEDYDANGVHIWLEHFEKSMYNLMIADYLIQKECLGKECLGKSCVRFLENQKTKAPNFSSEEITRFINSLHLPNDQFEMLKNSLRSYKPSKYIRGHFFLGASLCFVNHEINRLRPRKVKRSIDNDAFYTMLILKLKELISKYSELQSLREKAIEAAQKVVNRLATSNVHEMHS